MPEKVLYVMDEGIGNMVMALPAINAIHAAGYETHVLGKEPALSLIPAEIRAWTEVDPSLQFDYILMSPWSQSYEQHLKDQPDANVYRADPVTELTHESILHFDLASVLADVEMPKDLKDITLPDIPITETEIPDKPYIVFANTAAPGWDKKRYTKYWLLAKRLAKADYQVVVLGAEPDALFNHPEQFPEDTIFHYDLPLTKSAYLMKHAYAVVGNDCGLTHIASAMETLTIALFGPTAVTKNAPLGYHQDDPRTVIVMPLMACSPCQFREYQSVCMSAECLEAIKTHQIYTAIIDNGYVATDTEYPIHKITPVPEFITKPQKLAVVTRVKNGMDTLAEYLDAAKRVADIFCFVDNGSTDGTLEALHAFGNENPDKHTYIAETEGYDEIRDREVMDKLLRQSAATWGLFLDADEIVSEQITREHVEFWMSNHNINAVYFRHVHFWQDKEHYRVDQRWKPRHSRLMWRITPESTLTTDKHIHPGIVRNLKGEGHYTDFCIKHYGHIDKAKSKARAAFYKSIDNPSLPNWTGKTYDYQTDEKQAVLAEWHEDTIITARNFGRPSLLLVLLHGHGDMLMATPTIAKLKAETPDLELSVLGLGQTKERDFKTREIFENNPHVDHYYDSTIDHHPEWWDDKSWQSRALPVIQKDIERLEQTTRFDKVSILHLQSDFQRHKIDRFAEACGLTLSDNEKQMRLYPSEADKEWVDKLLDSYALGRARSFISVHRWCGHPPKSWDYEQYKQLIDKLINDTSATLILWDMSDPESLVEGENIINMRNYADELTIGRAAALMAICDVHIGPDSFPMHIASAMNTPTLAIFEKTAVSVSAPIDDSAVIATTTNAAAYSDAGFFSEATAKRIAMCGLETVEAIHLYPILAEMGFLDKKETPWYEPAQFHYEGHDITAPVYDGDDFANIDWKEQKVAKALRNYITPDTMFMDIGANVGRFSLLVAKEVAHLVCIEPSPEIFEMLKSNTENLEGCLVHLENCALSDTEKTLTLNWTARHSGSARTDDHRQLFLSTEVPAKTLDSLAYRPDVIKIDVEGAELAVLEGGQEVFANARAVAVEVHTNVDPHAVIDYFKARDFDVRYVTPPAQFAPHHILFTAKDEPVLPFPTNCLYDPAELLTRNVISKASSDFYFSQSQIASDQMRGYVPDTTYWFEYAALYRNRARPPQQERNSPYNTDDCAMDMLTFLPSGEGALFSRLDGRQPKQMFLNFLYSNTGEPMRFRGELVYPLCQRTLQAFLAKCFEHGYSLEPDKTDFNNVEITDPRNLPDPNVPVTRGRMLLSRH